MNRDSDPSGRSDPLGAIYDPDNRRRTYPELPDGWRYIRDGDFRIPGDHCELKRPRNVKKVSWVVTGDDYGDEPRESICSCCSWVCSCCSWAVLISEDLPEELATPPPSTKPTRWPSWDRLCR